MDRTDCAIVVNTCPKYFYLLEVHFALLRRYGAGVKWPVYLATERPDDFLICRICKLYNINIIRLDDNEKDFLESRWAAIKKLPSEIKYVLPLQEDFLIERPPHDIDSLSEALSIFDINEQVISIRLMPCPGSSAKEPYIGKWNKLMSSDMLFSYQATLWRREVYTNYMLRLIQQGHEQYPTLSGSSWNHYCVGVNPAETHPGLTLLKFMYPIGVHLCYPRLHTFPNGVLWCPIPYRPTAVVKGVLQPWAEELIHREGFTTMPSLR